MRAASRLTGQDPDIQPGSLSAVPSGQLLTVVILCALLLTMPFWSMGLSPQAWSVLNQEIGLAALAAALAQMILGECGP
jgi:hypothetical protein